MLKERLAGLEVEGSWDDIVSCCAAVSRTFWSENLAESSIGEWDEWRPRSGERLGQEVTRKTIESSVHEPLDAPGDGLLRRFEEAVYGLMTRAGNYYFDNDLLSASVERAGGDTYALILTIHSRNLRQKVKDQLLPQA